MPYLVRSACFAFENYGPVWEVGGERKGGHGQKIKGAVRDLERRIAATIKAIDELAEMQEIEGR
jgi:hypothetical protein